MQPPCGRRSWCVCGAPRSKEAYNPTSSAYDIWDTCERWVCRDMGVSVLWLEDGGRVWSLVYIPGVVVSGVAAVRLGGSCARRRVTRLPQTLLTGGIAVCRESVRVGCSSVR